MFRFLLVVFLATTSAAAEQGEMLVEHPPIYKSGESAKGVIMYQTGLEYQLLQEAKPGPDGQIYVFMTMVDEGGNARAHLAFNPHTWRMWSVTETEVFKILDTTCSEDGLYPITLGKVYECTSTIEVNGRALDSRTRMEFDHAERDESGRLQGFCALSKEDDDEYTIESRVCLSGDGKWARTINFLEVTPKQSI